MPSTDLRLRVAATVATEALLGLAARAPEAPVENSWWNERRIPRDGRHALDGVGDRSGEVWLHLLGRAEAWTGGLGELIGELRSLAPPQLLAEVLGVEVPAWLERVSKDTIEAAAEGDAQARARLLDMPDYYGGHARDALTELFELTPQDGADRILNALEAWHTWAVEPSLDTITAWQRQMLTRWAKGKGPVLKRVERITGIRYEPEDYVRGIVLIPRMCGGGVVLAQHRTSRLIAFTHASDGGDPRHDLSAVFTSLGDSTRLDILKLLAEEPRGVSELADAMGLAKSTVHQHVGLLRNAGVVTLAGQAWRYRYEIDRERVAAATESLLDYLKDTEGLP